MLVEQDAIIIQPAQKPVVSMIWLHGLGADGSDFASLASDLNISKHLSIRFIFPHAPMRAVTINGGAHMRAWYDIYSLTQLDREDIAGIQNAQQLVEELIQQEIASGIASQNIVLGGFSQGGAVALYMALHSTLKLAGFIALSTYLPGISHPNQISAINQQTPILMMHGLYDPVIPLVAAQRSHHYLSQNRYQVEWHDYPMGHQVCAPQITVINQWLEKNLVTIHH